MGDNLFDLDIGDKRPVNARNATAAGHVQHVALAQQLLAALFAQNGSAVDFRGHLERDAGREIGLDRAGDHIHRRALRRHDQMDARRARHLRQPLDRAFDILASHHHQVGHFIDHHDNIGQRRQLHRLLLIDGLAGLAVVAGLDNAHDCLAFGFRLQHAGIEPIDIADIDL